MRKRIWWVTTFLTGYRRLKWLPNIFHYSAGFWAPRASLATERFILHSNISFGLDQPFLPSRPKGNLTIQEFAGQWEGWLYLLFHAGFKKVANQRCAKRWG